MSAIVDLSGLERLIARVRKLENPNATTLMKTWTALIEQDNRRGVLAGLDKDGNKMAPVKYRPVTAKPIKIGSKAAAGLRNTSGRKGVFAGFGIHSAGLNNNLTSSQYRQLDGPPLAPRRQFSRVITNLKTDFIRPSDMDREWTAYGYWDEVVSRKGVMFLPAHFRGRAGLPRRDLAGVRPEGREKARRAAIAWMADQIRTRG
jgi:hypothetical protein